MRAIHFLLPFLFFLLATACQEDSGSSCSVSIQLVLPDKEAQLALDGIKVTLTSKSNHGITYTATTSSTGLATFNAEHDEYVASVHCQTAKGVIFNGKVESIILSPDLNGIAGTITLNLLRSQTNALVIQEIYYGGGLDKKGEWYNADQYVTLYNNSDATLYLDGLCVGAVDPGTNSSESPWMKENPEMKKIPVQDFTWQFPGTGTEYPLLSGQSTTIATNAVDHTGGEYGHPGLINLSKVDWAFWEKGLKMQAVPALGVTSMNLLLRTNSMGNRYILPVVGPALIVFNIQAPEGADAYVSNKNHRRSRPGENLQGLEYLMIPCEWVIDCVECVESAEQIPNCRTPAVLNIQPAYMPGGTYKGTSLIRKQTTTIDGRIVYQDTNNSAEDLIVTAPLLKKK